jgi:hypothetical protein
MIKTKLSSSEFKSLIEKYGWTALTRLLGESDEKTCVML